MGQYYIAVNIDKKEYIQPHACGDGAKLLEFALGRAGFMSCLALLLADGNGRGGGDLFGAKCPKCEGGVLRRKDGTPRRHRGGPRDGLVKICPKCKAVGRVPAPEIVGSWAGDRVVIAGDYGDNGKFLPDGREDGPNLYAAVYAEGSEFRNVSEDVMRALAGDRWAAEYMGESAA